MASACYRLLSNCNGYRGEGGVVVGVVLAAILEKTDARARLRGPAELNSNSAKNKRDARVIEAVVVEGAQQ